MIDETLHIIQVETRADFDLSKYLGRWYEIEKYPNWFERGSCNAAEYKLKNNGGIAVNNSEVQLFGNDNVLLT